MREFLRCFVNKGGAKKCHGNTLCAFSLVVHDKSGAIRASITEQFINC